ncbi:MAG TPA: winged helix DNA-binding domain-containing protein [Acidimicrobiia bacterium]|nr:winged helix DNA-binding domain-containing protein [Acidimicrobiia bacterium]
MTPPIPWSSTHIDRRPASIVEVAAGSLGLYVSPPVSHLELMARLPDHRPEDLERLLDDRALIGLRTLRGSAFLVPVGLLPVVVPATRDRNVRAFGTYLRRSLTTAPYEAWAERVDDVLGDGMATKAEITERLDPPEPDRRFMTNVISQMATESRLVGVRRARSWRSAEIAYTRWATWLPGVDVATPDPGECRTVLARWYLERFAPATVDDFAWWSGLTKAQARFAIEASGADPSAGPGGDPPRGVRLLPIWDALFVTWKDRSRFLPDGLTPYVYDASGNATSVVLVDGAVAGVWAMTVDGDRLEVRASPFGSFAPTVWSGVEEEAGRIAQMAGLGSAEVVRGAEPVDLTTAPRNRFMSPV